MQEAGINHLDTTKLIEAFRLMSLARAMADKYDEQKNVAKYVHSTSKGHEAIQLATAFHLNADDYVSPYYRDESILLGLGFTPYELMLQLLAKAEDPFSGGRTYYAHPSSNRKDMPIIPHQSSATGMQAIPTAGMAQGVQYLEKKGLLNTPEPPVVVCSLGDGSVTEGEVSEALSFAALKQLPIIFLVQDNDWGISVSSDEARTMDAFEYAAGFKGLHRMTFNGSDFATAYKKMGTAFDFVRKERQPILVHAKVPLLGHHTSGVRKEWYRGEEDLAKHELRDPYPILEQLLVAEGVSAEEIENIKQTTKTQIDADFDAALSAEDPTIDSLYSHEFAPATHTEEVGVRSPAGKDKVVMVDAALHAVDELLKKHPEAIFFGQDVGGRLGGVFREAATLAQKHGDDRVFNTAIQEAYLVGSTAGLSAVGVKAMVEIQFADYIWPGINQLVTELSKSCYLSMGKFPVQSLIRIPIGAYGGGGPYHSGCIESSVLSTRGIKVVFPSNAADLKGLMKAAFYDPNPVVMFEHKGLYWSKVHGTKAAMTVEPDEDYIIPLGKGRIALEADLDKVEEGDSCVVITYGMGVHWALNAAKELDGNVEIIDLRTLNPLDEELIFSQVKKHGKCLVLTEEQIMNSFAEALAGRISKECFEVLDAPVQYLGAKNLPAIPLNIALEAEMLPTTEKVKTAIMDLLAY